MFTVLFLIILAFNKVAPSYINFADTDCGTSDTKRAGRIVGGSDATFGQFPWLISITRHGGHFCGGSIINKQWILTAAHCLCSGTGSILQANQLKVTLAQYNLSEKGQESYEMDVKNVIIHPQYTCNRVANDIALLQLDKNIVWSNFVKPACLANINARDSEDATFEGEEATVAGWGWLGENSATGRANVLQKVDVKVISNSKCNDWYRSNGKRTLIRDSQMCAGHESGGKDSCWADSGGPLMIPNNGKDMVVGVVSTGIGCARPKLPGLYTRVSNYIEWIQSNIN